MAARLPAHTRHGGHRQAGSQCCMHCRAPGDRSTPDTVSPTAGFGFGGSSAPATSSATSVFGSFSGVPSSVGQAPSAAFGTPSGGTGPGPFASCFGASSSSAFGGDRSAVSTTPCTIHVCMARASVGIGTPCRGRWGELGHVYKQICLVPGFHMLNALTEASMACSCRLLLSCPEHLSVCA